MFNIPIASGPWPGGNPFAAALLAILATVIGLMGRH
jgi:hypothetical protein